mgnify:CR=1 FL=1
MRLNDTLVTSFDYKGEEYEIDLSFDVVLDVFDILDMPELRSYEKAETCLLLLLNKRFEGLEAVELWNYVFENFIEFKVKKAVEYDLQGNPMPPRKDDDDEKFIDLNLDAEYIYTSFRQAYQMDLYEEQGRLHWHKFKALLNGLPSDTIMQRIIQIRSWKPSKGESNEYKQSMKELQRIYALPDDDEGEEVDD